MLAVGLEGARSLTPDGAEALIVATDRGLMRVTVEGVATPVGPAARAVTTQPGRVIWLDDAGVSWAPLDGAVVSERARPAGPPAGRVAAPGAMDILGWSDSRVLVSYPDRVEILHLGSGRAEVGWTALPGPVTLALDAEADGILAAGAGGLWLLAEGRAAALLAQAEGARAAAGEPGGRRWLVHGEPPVLSRLEGDTLVQVAAHLGDPRDLHLGSGGLLRPDHLYLADAEGTVDYLPLPSAAP